MKYINLLLIICFMASSQLAVGQLNQYSFKQLTNKAAEAYEVGHYIEALQYYSQAKTLNDDYSPELLYNLGDAAYKVNSLAIAKENFTEYLKYDDTNYESDALYKLARIDHYSGNYQTALTAYDLYLSEFRDKDIKLTKEADFHRAAAEWATTNTEEDQIKSVTRLDNKYNTNATENAPYYFQDNLYYSSQNYPIPNDKLERTKAELLKEAVVMEIPNVKEDQLVSNMTFTEDGTKMIFTICDYVNEYAIMCNLYSADVDAAQNISNVTKLPDFINVIGTTTSHPSIVKKGEDYELYFSSNRVGGKGQIDIYKSNVTSNLTYSTPENVAAINTAGNDLTPHYHGPTKTLYFSSDGRNGYGGFDIYKLEEGEAPVNLGKTINSAYNDLYFTLDTDEIQAHFTSNRPGSLYAQDKYETCCYDIYSAKSKKCVIDLKTLAFDDKTKEPLSGVTIKIIDKENGTIIYDKTPDASESIIELPCNDKLKLTATRDGYEPLELDLGDLAATADNGEPITKSLYLTPVLYNLNLTILEEVSKMSVNEATVYLTDLSNNETQEQTNPGNIFNFSIKPNTEYLVEINKDGFKEEAFKFNSGDGSVTKEAILKYLDIVAKSIVSLENAIPVSLYFNNDMPDKGTLRTTSTQTYTETFDDYYSQKDRFKNAYLGLFNGSDKLTANQEMEYLFEENIHKGFKKYDIFKKQLLIVLEAGQDANVYLRGYASPLAQSEYNTNLGQRRVDSIRKEFDSWNNGVLKPYIQSGQLKVTERSFGETTSPAGISDDPSSPSKSIFSPAASKERRVEIDEIKFN